MNETKPPTEQAAEKPKRTKRPQIQPKTQAPKSKLAVKMRRKKIIKALAEGKTQQEAGIIAGLSPKTAGQQVQKTLSNPIIANALIAEMEKAGVTDELLAERLHTLLFGTKVISANIFAPGSPIPGGGPDLADANGMTKDFVEVPDNVALAKGIEIACKIKGQFTEKHEHDIKQPITVIIRKFCSPTDPAAGVDQSPEGGAKT